MNWLWTSIFHAAAMFWEVLWALVFGFTISAVLQVFVSKEQMVQHFGKVNLGSMTLATLLGAASSSCSYAAAAAARSAFQKGAALIVVLAFMFASTNLVVELGAVLWLLMGWQFVAAEVAGALLLIAFIWALGALTLPKNLEEEARAHIIRGQRSMADEHHCHHHSMGAGEGDRWTQIANAFIMDWSMLWKEMAVGFVIAGILGTLVPPDWWKALFLNGSPPLVQSVENAIVGPLVAVASFVCSIGNIPLASVLWSGGISFGGVISFIYADLIVIPLVLVYRKYYGSRPSFFIVATMFVSMVLAGVVVDALFTALHLVPTGPRPTNAVAEANFSWNYTTFLDFAAIAWSVWLGFLYVRQPKHAHAHHHH
jgi:uncharacterized membrane protein YraQ (UPF0718 family)